MGKSPEKRRQQSLRSSAPVKPPVTTVPPATSPPKPVHPVLNRGNELRRSQDEEESDPIRGGFPSVF